MGIGFCLEEKVVFLRRGHFGCVGNATYGDFGCVNNATYGTLVALTTQHTELATNEQNKT